MALSKIDQISLSSNVAGNGPAFSAYLSSDQTVSSATFTKIAFNTEEFDTNSNYDNATNYRFTPTVAGYYQCSAVLQQGNSVSCTQLLISFYKNGSSFKQGSDNAVSGVQSVNASALIYCNGSTDYIEAYGYNAGAGTIKFTGGQSLTYFQASMVRAA